MNVFLLDDNIEKSVQYHLDTHTNKIVVETAQILSTALEHESIIPYLRGHLYRPTHQFHPLCKWAKESWNNKIWLCDYGIALRNEYVIRYNKPENLLKELTIFKLTKIESHCRELGEITKRPQCMPKECIISDNIIENYRNYYNMEKRHLFRKKDGTPRWTNRNIPDWIKL